MGSMGWAEGDTGLVERAEAVKDVGVGAGVVAGAVIGEKLRRRGEMLGLIGSAAGSRVEPQAAVSGAERESPGGDQRHSSSRELSSGRQEKKRKEKEKKKEDGEEENVRR